MNVVNKITKVIKHHHGAKKVKKAPGFDKSVSKCGLESEYQMKWWEHIWWPIERFFKEIIWKLKCVKFFFQRGKRGWADCDVWSFDSYLAEVISGGLKDLAKYSHSYPGQGEMNTWGKWKRKLLKMAKAFDDYNKLHNSYGRLPKSGDKKGWENYFKKRQKKSDAIALEMHDVVKYFGHLWD